MSLRSGTVAVLLALAAPAHAHAETVVVPAEGHERGTIMFIHGGAWVGGRPAREVANAHAFAARGWRGISVDYPLGDLVAAYRSVENEAGALRGRRGPLVAIGQSAGGTMAEWLAARNEVDAAVAVDAPANLVSWQAVKPGGPLAWLPARVGGFDHSGWALSPERVYRRSTAAPLLVFGARDDHVVEPAQQSAMQELGAELAWTPGDHLASRRWRSPAAAFVRRVTRP